MAKSHHRKKHKQHLRSYQQGQDITTKPGRTKVTRMFTMLGAAAGFAIGYFASFTLLWLIIGAIVGGAIGFWIGNKMDQPA